MRNEGADRDGEWGEHRVSATGIRYVACVSSAVSVCGENMAYDDVRMFSQYSRSQRGESKNRLRSHNTTAAAFFIVVKRLYTHTLTTGAHREARNTPPKGRFLAGGHTGRACNTAPYRPQINPCPRLPTCPHHTRRKAPPTSPTRATTRRLLAACDARRRRRCGRESMMQKPAMHAAGGH